VSAGWCQLIAAPSPLPTPPPFRHTKSDLKSSAGTSTDGRNLLSFQFLHPVYITAARDQIAHEGRPLEAW
jgi:hypothetical protein